MKIFDKIKKVSPINAILILCGVVLLGSVSVLFGYTFCNNGLIIASSKQNVSDYYLIQADCFNDYDEAVNFSKQVQSRGGAGFIRFDDGFRVFVAGYQTEKEAVSVLNKIDGFSNKKVYALKVDEFNFDNGFSQNINAVFKNNIISFKYAIESLNEILIKFDKGEKSEIDVKNCCMLILEELEQQIDRFMNNYVKDYSMIKYKNYINEFYDMIEVVTDLTCEGNEFSAIVKYQEIGCMFKLQDILKIV